MDENLLQIIFDPQTSGGLLLGVARERATKLLDALLAGGYPRARVIGEVTARDADAAEAVSIC